MQPKKPTKFEEQIELIKNKGFIIDDEIICKNFLQNVNYYRISAYLLPFKDINGKYKINMKFTTIYKIYEFDRKLSLLLFSAIEKIEIYLRIQLAYYHSHKYGELGYMEKDSFSKKHKHDEFNIKIHKCIENNKNSKIVTHHNNVYDGKFPLWVVIEFFSMGMLSYFYSDMVLEDKKYIAKECFNTTYKHLDSWLYCLTELRNMCAHYSRLYFWSFPAYAKMPKNIVINNNQYLFPQIIMLKYMYPKIYKWDSEFVIPLKLIIEEYNEYINLIHIGFPSDWEKFIYI